MIRGTVSAQHEPIVHLRVRGPSGVLSMVDVVVDTGYTGYTGLLGLPDAVVAALGLPWRMSGTTVLADGTSHHTDYYAVELEWGTVWVTVLAASVGPQAVLGIKLLYGHRLTVEGSPGGRAEIVPWP